MEMGLVLLTVCPSTAAHTIILPQASAFAAVEEQCYWVEQPAINDVATME